MLSLEVLTIGVGGMEIDIEAGTLEFCAFVPWTSTGAGVVGGGGRITAFERIRVAGIHFNDFADFFVLEMNGLHDEIKTRRCFPSDP